MPYTGKPSGACLTCRNRRIKCDETRPACLKCHSSNRTCLGYKDPSQVKFRDMTAMTIRRYKASPDDSSSSSPESPLDDEPDHKHDPVYSQASETTPRDDVTSAYGVLVLDPRSSRHARGRQTTKAALKGDLTWRLKETTKLLAPPTTSVNQHSISYLFTAYLGAANHFLDTGFSGVLETVVQKGKPPRYLSAAISATSIAAFSRRPNARLLTTRAEKVYSRALVEINATLKRPSAIHDDELLAAILILALYELFMSNHLTGYYNHILGAAVILKSRQSEHLTSPTAAMAFILTRNEIMKTALLTPLSSVEKDLNPWMQWMHTLGLDKWTSSAFQHLPVSVMSGPIMHFKALLYQALEESMVTRSKPPSKVSCDVSNQSSPDVGNAANSSPSGTPPCSPSVEYFAGVLRQFLDGKHRFADVDRIMLELYNMGPAPPQPIPADLPREVDGWVLFTDSPVYVYQSMLHAGFRLAMTLLYLEPCSKAAVFVSSVPESVIQSVRELEEFQELHACGEKAVAEIVGSVPYFCGLLPSSMLGGEQPSKLCDVAGIRDAHAISFGIWTMAAAVMSPFTTGVHRKYMLNMLRYCHQVKGVGQAAALYEACMEVARRATTTPHQSGASSIPAAWMGRGTSLEALIYGVKTEEAL